MLREEAINFFENCSIKNFELCSTSDVVELTGAKAITHQIYDYFEKERVCENCKYCVSITTGPYSAHFECRNRKSLMFGKQLNEEDGDIYDFGCNKFTKTKNV